MGWEGVGKVGRMGGTPPRTHLVIMRRKLMQQLSHTILLPRTVDVWHFVVGYLREIQANLRENGADGFEW